MVQAWSAEASSVVIEVFTCRRNSTPTRPARVFMLHFETLDFGGFAVRKTRLNARILKVRFFFCLF